MLFEWFYCFFFIFSSCLWQRNQFQVYIPEGLLREKTNKRDLISRFIKVTSKQNLTYDWITSFTRLLPLAHLWNPYKVQNIHLRIVIFFLFGKKNKELHQCKKSRAVKSWFTGWTEAWSSQRASRCSTCVSQCFLFVALSMLLCKLPTSESHAWTQQLLHTVLCGHFELHTRNQWRISNF